MAKFGKKNVVSNDMSSFIIGLVAPSGWGKSTLMYEVCEELYGGDGYICADFGLEDGYAAIHDANVEKCATWKHFKDMVDDIVKNKANDYPNLKVVVWDTLDAAFERAEEYAVSCFNKEHMGEQNFRPAVSVNSVDGGYGKGLDRTIAYVKKEINRLKSVGVGTFFTAHCKERDQTDLFTGNTFTQLTASLTNRYFGSIKDISHVIGFGYYAREMQHVEVGEANPITKKKKTREAMVKEDRKIRFRDTDYLCDAKSRFADIEPEINLNRDEFIEAINQAIAAAGGKKVAAPKVVKQTIAPVVEQDELEVEEEEDDAPFDIEEEFEDEEAEMEYDFDAIRTELRNKHKAGTPEQKKAMKAILASTGRKLDEVDDIEALTQMLEIFE